MRWKANWTGVSTAWFALSCMLFLCVSAPVFSQTIPSVQRADGAAIPIKNYAPAAGASCAPTMILSHGFGGDQNTMSGLANAMAAKGWRVIAMAHGESGREQLRAAFRSGGGFAAVEASARERSKHVARFADLDAVYAEATRACRTPRLVLAGHSMGAQTTMMEAGAKPLIGSMGRNRFDAYIALSPQGIGTTYAAGAWSGVTKPVLMITGTNDRSAEADYTLRLSAFEGLPPGNKRLAVIAGAGHLQLGGIGSSSVGATVNALVGKFLDQLATGRLSQSRIAGTTVRDK